MRISTKIAIPAAALMAGSAVLTAGAAVAAPDASTNSGYSASQIRAAIEYKVQTDTSFKKAFFAELAQDPEFQRLVKAEIRAKAQGQSAPRQSAPKQSSSNENTQTQSRSNSGNTESSSSNNTQRSETSASSSQQSSNAGGSSSASSWAQGGSAMKVKNCESGNNYSTNTGNGYYGAWQFDHPSWHANGGGQYAEYPHQASQAAQDQVAYNYYQKAGWGPWACKG